jgi:hypothetical protein
MTKKRGGIADGIRTVYHVQQVFDAIESATAPKIRQFLEGVGMLLMMGISLAAVCAIFWLLNLAIHFFKS